MLYLQLEDDFISTKPYSKNVVFLVAQQPQLSFLLFWIQTVMIIFCRLVISCWVSPQRISCLLPLLSIVSSPLEPKTSISLVFTSLHTFFGLPLPVLLGTPMLSALLQPTQHFALLHARSSVVLLLSWCDTSLVNISFEFCQEVFDLRPSHHPRFCYF